jgi:hypothetical protein
MTNSLIDFFGVAKVRVPVILKGNEKDVASKSDFVAYL